jgi:hypothetical protein
VILAPVLALLACPCATPPAPCAGGTRLARSSLVSVYRRKNGFARACLNSGQRRGTRLDDGEDVVLDPPALAASGYLVAYAVVYVDFYDAYDTDVEVRDFSPTGNGAVVEGFPKATARNYEQGVGSVTVTPGGTVAFITCRYQDERTGLQPTCVDPTRASSVLVAVRGRSTRSIARGRGIDPQSLRAKRKRITWRQNDQLRTLTVP